jgi:deferrochelatase/peroxidase EfeB
MPAPTFTATDQADTQALLKTGFDNLYCCYLLLRIDDAQRARHWLRGQLGQITRFDQVGDGKRVSHARQLALTAAGLRKLGLGEELMERFSPEFGIGLADDPSRSRRLGDIGNNDPARWVWGSGPTEPHVLLAIFDENDENGSLTQSLRDDALASGFSDGRILNSGDMGDREPFGFRDGASQPTIDWKGERTPNSAGDMDFHNLIAPGEFLLGYINEYGLYTERPLLDAQAVGAATLPAAEDQPGLRDLGRNGTYLVFRQLQQDVRGFWRWVHQEAGEGEEAATGLAEAMVGRHIKGEPFAALGSKDIPGIRNKPGYPRNDFTYSGDRAGQVCPVGAHIRRANPRTGDYPNGRTGILKKLLTLLGLTGTPEEDRIASARFHRVLRRGREYGEELDRYEALKPDAKDPQSGLHFICLNANPARQFEFVQGAWLASAKFAGMSNEQDPLLGNRAPFPANQANDRFTRPTADGPCRVAASLPQFVTVVGGAYFFLPGLRALDWLLRDQ